MIDITEIESRLQGHGLVHSVDPLPKGAIRVETAFKYPDGGSIDIFVVERRDLVSKEVWLTDYGQTMSWLLLVDVKPWLSKKRQGFLEDTLRIYGVDQRGGELVKTLTSLDDLVSGVVSLGQTCVRASDLMFTKRSAMATPFADQVEDVLSDVEMEYTPNEELEGRYGNTVRVDFLVQGPRVVSALLGLSSGNSSQAHVAATEIFRRWYDLDVAHRREQRITVFDDSVDVYRDEDLERLKGVSDLVAVSDRQMLKDLLAA